MVTIRFFSDNVYLSLPLKEGKKVFSNNLAEIVRIAGSIQLFLSNRGLFVRGGIAVGKEYRTLITVYGSALGRALMGESRAKVPRIILDESFSSNCSKFKDDMSQTSDRFLGNFIRKDRDGSEFVDYLALTRTSLFEGESARALLRVHKKNILAEIRYNRDQPTILGKYRWLAEYHNSYGKPLGVTINQEKFQRNST